VTDLSDIHIPFNRFLGEICRYLLVFLVLQGFSSSIHKASLIPTIMINFIIYEQKLRTNPLMLISELRLALSEREARGGNIKLQLRLNRFKTIKLALATQEMLKRHTYFLTV